MKYFSILLVIVLVVTGLFFGYINVIGKIMHRKPKKDNPQYMHLQQQQKKRAKQIRERQKRLMQDQKIRLRDHRARYKK